MPSTWCAATSSDNFGKKIPASGENQYASKENSQEAAAIRPSDVSVLAESLKDMEADAQKLYQLIWRQFVACQMTPAQYDSTTLTVGAGDFRLKSAWPYPCASMAGLK